MTSMPFFSRISRITIPVVCLTLALTGCGGGGGGGGNNTGSSDDGQTLKQVLSKPLGEETSCPKLALSDNQGVPGDEITVAGLPSDMGEISMRVIAEREDGDREIDPLFVRVDEDTDEISFVVPVHPLGDPEGGEVQLEPGDGDMHCPALTFNIEALPEADPDYTVTMAEDLEAWTDRVLNKLGYDPQQLLDADREQVPEARLGVWFIKQYVSGDREDSLPNLAARARNDDNELLARLLKASGLEQAINQAITDMDSTTDGRLETESRSFENNKVLVRSGDPGIAKSTTTKSQSSPGDCDAQAFEPDQLQIGGPEDLSERIKAAREGQLFDGSASGRVLGQASLADIGGTGDAAGYLGTGVFVVSTVDAAKQALEPQRITDFDIESVGRKWVEDRELPDDPPLVWGGASVHAEGSEFNLSQATLESLVTALGMAPGPVGTATTAASTFSSDSINSAIEDLTEDSCVRIRAPEYGPIEGIDNPQWTEVTTGNTIELVNATDGWSQEYKGVNIGPSPLRISLKEEPFALQRSWVKDFTVDVVQVNTSLIPSSENVTEAGETVTLAATATNSYEDKHQTDFTASLPNDKGSILNQGVNGDHYEVEYETPQNRDDFPVEVAFTANHPTLPDGEGRTYKVEVDIGGELAINERNACLNPGQSQSFSATIDGFADDKQVVNWEVSSGTINSTGDLTADYQAPSTTGSVEITATADADDSVTDSVSITVSENCMRKLWVPGASINLDANGDYVNSSVSDCPGGTVQDPGEVQEKKLEAENPPASIPDLLERDDYWYDRSKDLSGTLSHGSKRYLYDDATDECLNVSLSGQNNTTLEYAANADGTLSASLDSELQIECQSYGDSDETIECSSGGSSMGLGMGSYIMDLTEERSLILEGELSCAALEGNAGIGVPISDVGLTADVSRFVDGDRWEPPEGSTGVEYPDGSVRAPQLLEITCDQSDDVVSINEEFVLTAPPEGETHQVVISLTGGLQTAPSWDGKDHFGPPTNPADLDRVTGTHKSNADIDLSVKLSPN